MDVPENMETPVDEDFVQQCSMLLMKDGIPMAEAINACKAAYVQSLSLEKRDNMESEQTDSETALVYNEITKFSTDDERYVLGPVLVPNVVDTQGHLFPESSVRKTAFKFMREYKKNKFMHVLDLNADDITIVENYVAPADFELNGRVVRKGTWMMGVIIHNDVLWNHIKEGRVRGFSIGAKVTKSGITVDSGG